MPTAKASYSVSDHLADRAPVVAKVYRAILARARKFGPVREEAKQSSIHLVARTAFAGVATRKDAVILTFKSPSDIRNPRIRKHERASANSWHLEVRLEDLSEVDAEVVAWLKASYEMSR